MMKKMTGVLWTLVLLLTLCLPAAQAEEANAVMFSDPALEDAVRSTIGKKEGGITAADVEDITVMNFGKFAENSITSLEGMEAFTALESIRLNGQAITDLSPLSGLEHLVSIELGDSRISNLEPLRGMELRELLLYGNQIADVSPLQEMQSLEVLVLAGNSIGDISPLAGLENLRVLMLGDNGIADYTPLAALCDRLEERDFEPVKLEELAFADPVLEQKIRDWFDRPTGSLFTYEFEYEGYLGLGYDGEGERITDISGMEAFQGLDSLELYGNAISDLTPLAGMTYLRELNLDGNEVSDLTPLQDMRNLEMLNLANNQITDISALAGMTKLTCLFLSGNGITDYGPVAEIYGNLVEWDFELDGATVMRMEGKDPDEVVSFADPVLEGMIRGALGIPDGNITAADAAGAWDLNLMMDGGDWTSPRIIDLSGMEYFTNLRGLNLGWALTAEGGNFDLSPLAGLTQLEGLAINNCSVTDLGPLAGLTNLVEFCAFGNTIADLSPLADMARMDTLWLNNNQITDIGVLVNLPNLVRVYLAENMITDLSPLHGLANLSELEISGNPVLDYEPIRAIIEQLNSLDMDPEEMFAQLDMPDDPQQAVVFRNALLESLVRDDLGIPDGELTAGDMAKITNFNHNNEWQERIPEEIQISDLTGLEYCINLRSLSLNYNAVGDLSALQGLTKLKKLSVNSNRITDIGPLAGLTELRELWFYSNEVADLSPLAGLTQLTALQFDYNRVSDISVLEGLTELTYLSMHHNNISDLWPISAMQNLQELYLDGNPIADFSPIEYIVPYLQGYDGADGQTEDPQPYTPDNANEVIFFADPVLEAGVREQIEKPEGDILVKDIFNTEELFFGNYDGAPEEAQIHDLTGLAYFENLRLLDLNDNAVSDLTPIAGMGKLWQLNVSENNITDITPLRELYALEWLALSGNAIADISALAELGSLRELFLENNQITDITALAGLRNLVWLTMMDNPIADFTPVEEIYPQLETKDF